MDTVFLPEAFTSKVDISNTNFCWKWKGPQNHQGYGLFWDGDKLWYAHKYSYVHYKAEVPKGYMVKHTCESKICVNPEHLKLEQVKKRR